MEGGVQIDNFSEHITWVKSFLTHFSSRTFNQTHSESI